MTKEDKKAARKKVLDDAFNVKNGNAVGAVGNWLRLIQTPLGVVFIIVAVAIFLMLGNVNKALKAIRDLPETCSQVDDNTEAIGVLFVYHEEQEERLDELDDRVLVQETRDHYARRRVD